MIDPSVQLLLEEAVDSPLKLQLLLLFHESPWLEATSTYVASRACRDIWSTVEALRELHHDGILRVVKTDDGEPVYGYGPADHRDEAICSLARSYADPLRRDAVQCAVRELASYAPFRREGGWFSMQ